MKMLMPYRVVVAEKKDPANVDNHIHLTFPNQNVALRFADECRASHPELWVMVGDAINLSTVDEGLAHVSMMYDPE